LCTGKPLEEAKEKCAVLKKEETEEEKEEIEEDEEAKEQQDATYVACISDVCQTANGDFGEAAKETEEESEMQAALKHKKAFRVAAADGDCKTGWTPTDSNDNFLSDEEKSRADKKKQGCTTACKVCRPAHRRYLIGPLALHNETQAACQNQQLAMPKSDGDKTRLSILQKKFCSAEKAWLGANYKDDAWKWADGSVVEGTGGITGKAGDYLCMDKEDGSYLNCDHRPDVKHDALCETIFY
ncbi:Updo, partial [Symbiodinium sp. CCMP2456]